MSPLWSRNEDRFQIRIDEPARERVRLYWDNLEKWNRKINLTTIPDFGEALTFHFFEAFWAARRFLQDSRALCDIGSGAGLPGLAIKIVQPALAVTLLEKSWKKCSFLRDTARRLELDVDIEESRAEETQAWKRADTITFRALRPSVGLVEYLERDWSGNVLGFEGRNEPFLEPDRLVERDRVPGSRNRFVSRYHLPGTHCST